MEGGRGRRGRVGRRWKWEESVQCLAGRNDYLHGAHTAYWSSSTTTRYACQNNRFVLLGMCRTRNDHLYIIYYSKFAKDHTMLVMEPS